MDNGKKIRKGDKMIDNIGVKVFYTWHDIESKLLANKPDWPFSLLKIEVYSDEMLIYIRNSCYEMEVLKYIQTLFGKYYDANSKSIKISTTNTELSIYFETAEDYVRKNSNQEPAPLFKEYLYVRKDIEQMSNELPGAKIIAFHSYKGGVGRTLSLIAFAKEIIETYNGSKKVLIVDADIEAPGLTWLSKEQNRELEISYLDMLSVIQSKGCEEQVIENISHIVEKSILNFETNTMTGTHYFLPTYRFEEQILDVYTNPERIMQGKENKYIIVDFLSMLGEKLGADMVLVDLRAGISEYSAPYLFDSRVNKFLVTSTSFQSVYGTKLLLKQMTKKRQNDNINILLTKVPNNDFTKEQKEKIYDSLISFNQKLDGSEDEIQDFNDDSLNLTLTDFIIEIPMSDVLIHLGDLDDICKKLKIAESVSNKVKELINIVYPEKKEKIDSQSENSIRKQYLDNLHDLASKELTAEGGGTSKILTTKSLEALGRDFKREIPQIVVLGVKGSGKTYLYKQMLYAKTWSDFLTYVGEEGKLDREVFIYPILSSSNRKYMKKPIDDCIKNCAAAMNGAMLDFDAQEDTKKQIRENYTKGINENQWIEFWSTTLLKTFYNKFDTLRQVDEFLQVQNKKVVFVIDGLEDNFADIDSNESQREAIKTLCIDFMNQLMDLPYNNIGIVTFLRKDIAEIAIKTNVEQFKNQYDKYELTWSQKEALRLALWLADNACVKGMERIYSNPIVPIKNAPSEVIEEALFKLWGKKMGPDSSKTAFSARWVIASLSDFNGQLQARDIVRFLKFATDSDEMDDRRNGNDRYLSVTKMKEAVKKCSDEKLSEITTEIKQLKPIFKKMSEEVESERKVVPLKEEVLNSLSIEEQETLRRYGYLLKAGDEYYIPECIRYALDYNKTRRGGIKVVSLLVQK